MTVKVLDKLTKEGCIQVNQNDVTTDKRPSPPMTNSSEAITKLSNILTPADGSAWAPFDDTEHDRYLPDRLADIGEEAVAALDLKYLPTQSAKAVMSVVNAQTVCRSRAATGNSLTCAADARPDPGEGIEVVHLSAQPSRRDRHAKRRIHRGGRRLIHRQ